MSTTYRVEGAYVVYGLRGACWIGWEERATFTTLAAARRYVECTLEPANHRVREITQY